MRPWALTLSFFTQVSRSNYLRGPEAEAEFFHVVHADDEVKKKVIHPDEVNARAATIHELIEMYPSLLPKERADTFEEFQQRRDKYRQLHIRARQGLKDDLFFFEPSEEDPVVFHKEVYAKSNHHESDYGFIQEEEEKGDPSSGFAKEFNIVDSDVHQSLTLHHDASVEVDAFASFSSPTTLLEVSTEENRRSIV